MSRGTLCGRFEALDRVMKKEPWHDSFLESLAELADIDRQRSTWVGGEANDLPSPSELVCQVFDDSGLDDFLRSGTVFSEPVDELLRELSNSVETFDLGKPAAELVADAEWVAIADRAGHALQKVQSILGD